LESVDPTVIAEGTKAGEKLQLSLLSFPPATTTDTPAPVAASTAVRMAELVPAPPRLMLATFGLAEFLAVQSNPPVIQDHWPLPWSLRTFTLRIVAPGATPYCVPAAEPAQ